jgi:hypothetical protein
MKHLGILAHSIEGAALCLGAFCQEGFREPGPHLWHRLARGPERPA